MKNKLIGLLIILLLAAAYYFAIYKSMEKEKKDLNSELSLIRAEIEQNKAEITKYSNMSKEIQEGKETGSMIYDYDNATSELSYLSGVAAKATEYNISFDDAITNDGIYVRRNVKISFIASNYDVAKGIIMDINNCPYRTLFKNVVITPISDSNDKTPTISNGSRVSVIADLQFIELCSDNNIGLSNNREGGKNE